MRWGIAGPGAISTRFTEAMRLVDGGSVVAVASRSGERAAEFARRFDLERHYGSYEDLAGDADVDIVYIGTPHSRHAADALLYLEAGKHVLCEKPFTLNAAQAKQVVSAAREQGRFVMEAMWTRFLPSYVALSEALAEGRIGEPLLVEADFGWRSPVDPTNRHFDLAQGGGALLDLGIYPVQLCFFVLGRPDGVVAYGHVGETGVVGDPEELVDTWPPEVAVNDHDTRPDARKGHSKVRRQGGLTLTGHRARDVECPDVLVVASELQ